MQIHILASVLFGLGGARRYIGTGSYGAPAGWCQIRDDQLITPSGKD